MIVGDLIEHLKGIAEVTDKLGERLYINRAPRGARTPYALLSVVSGDTPYSLAGEVGTTQSIVQVSTWASDPNGPFVAAEAAEMIRDKISGFRGEWNGRFIHDCSLTGEPTDLADAPDDAGDDWFHAVQQDYRVTHASGVPALA